MGQARRVDPELKAAFEADRSRLLSMAYRMLGSLLDAEDAVQETWIRLEGSDSDRIEKLGGWLTTVLSRVCLGMLRGRRNRQEPLMDDEWTDPATVGALEVEVLVLPDAG